MFTITQVILTYLHINIYINTHIVNNSLIFNCLLHNNIAIDSVNKLALNSLHVSILTNDDPVHCRNSADN